MAYTVFAGVGQWRAADQHSRQYGFFGFDPELDDWMALSDGLPDQVEVRHIVVRPDRPQTIFAGTQLGPYRSDDGGETWHSLSLPEGTSAEDSVVWSICLDPNDPQTVYVGTQGTAVFRSRSGGGNWERLPISLPPGAIVMTFPMRVVRISVSPGDSDEIIVGLEVGGLVRSLDGGETWQSCNAPLLELAEQDHLRSKILSDDETEGMMDSHSMAISQAHPDAVWLANRMGLFLSDDRAATWREVGIGRFSPLTYARDVKVSSHDPERMYTALSVAAVSDEGSLYRSDDFGATWSRFDHGVEVDSTAMIVAEGVSSPDRVYFGARRGRVLGTEDGGASWRSWQLPDGTEGIYALACV
ncbi:MAG: hypothetical protein HOL85_09105 [Rhodospirillaceae bacterium]|nr:hypothetical protein [Rhodospirillaceae bacterium]MBT6137687.1 hypothetical protein [Rhodospirillaceae bacterium]